MKKLFLSISAMMICLIGLSQNQLYVSNGAELYSDSGGSLFLNETHLINQGTVELQGMLNMTAMEADITNNSANSIQTSDVILAAGQFNLAGAVDISSFLLLTNLADLHLAGNGAITLGESGQLIGEDEDHVISGDDGAFITTTRTISTSSSFGNIGFTLNSADTNLGETKVYRYYGNGVINGNDIVLRYYEISATNNSGLNADATFQYAAVDLNGLTETNLSLFRSEGGSTNWEERGGTVNTSLNTVNLSGIEAFSTWIFAESGTVLPVKLIYFDAEAVNNNTIVCTWQTASEVNNSHFEIERSQNGQDFEFVGRITGAGNSSELLDYNFTDEQPYLGSSYYRLRQVDFDGQFDYSDIREVFIDTSTGILLYPNPAREQINLTIPNEIEVESYRILNANGQLMMQGDASNQLQLDVAALSNGLYFIELITTSEKTNTIKFIKNN